MSKSNIAASTKIKD